jgi:ABC-type bacteriocin/lantibiotic exporter with double-glycine peptidase domain
MNNTLHRGPFPLHITKNDDHFVIVTNHQTHYAKTFDPSAARLIASAPDLLSALDLLLNKINAHGLENKHMIATIEKAEMAIAKAKGEA